ncbi:MAG: hypothetical protein IMY69_00325 [Bacteroidetes bacterium]|jgi:hypothetical protein|nr:hypothetical protein [Bacteroidota bacterium]MCK4408110.1 hypothetical protein [Bacteroidales bacterium]
MKKSLLLFMIILGFIYCSFGQNIIENPGFELWEDAGASVDEPVDWNSIQTSDADFMIRNFAPVVLNRSTDAYRGKYSLQLINKSAAGTVDPGLTTNGRIHAVMDREKGYIYTDTADSRWNTPFTARPDSIVGWYKCFPKEGDNGKVQVVIHTGMASISENNSKKNWIGTAQFLLPSSEVSSWTRFSTPFTYFNSNTPEYILIILTSGNGLKAVDGSEAYFDALELKFNSGNDKK